MVKLALMSLILKMFNYPNPVENYPDRQIQMLWVSLSLLKCASGWQSEGPILPINKTSNIAKIVLWCSFLPYEPDGQVIIY